jgi:hypothetical protein
MSVRDGERFLSEAVESILDQTMRDFELIVVDDASTDRSAEILASHARRDPRLRVLRVDASAGLAGALNLGCEVARGTLVARMDADDVAAPDRLERQVAFLGEHGQVAVVGGAATLIAETGVPHEVRRPPLDDARIRATLRRRNCMIHPTVTMRRDVLCDTGGYRAAFVNAEDYDLWLRLAERHRFANLPDAVLRYRVHRGQASFQGLEQQVLSTLAAQVAARRRRAGDDDAAVAACPPTPAVLAALGVTEEVLREGLAMTALDRAADLADVGEETLAVTALALTPGYATSTGTRRQTLARYHAKRARRQWRRGQAVLSLASLARAVRTHPALAVRAAFALLRPRPGGR